MASFKCPLITQHVGKRYQPRITATPDKPQLAGSGSSVCYQITTVSTTLHLEEDISCIAMIGISINQNSMDREILKNYKYMYQVPNFIIHVHQSQSPDSEGQSG